MNFHFLFRHLPKTLSALVALIAAATLPASGGVFKVKNLNDDGKGSLRQAIRSANNGDRIEFLVSGCIRLTTGELVIDKDLSIEGPDANDLVIDASTNSRIFNISRPNAEVALRHLTFVNGKDIN